jgi:hypothetical protein
MTDEKIARFRTHRNNIHRFRRLFTTRLTELERQYLEERLAEELRAMETLSGDIFPLKLGTSNALRRSSSDAA